MGVKLDGKIYHFFIETQLFKYRTLFVHHWYSCNCLRHMIYRWFFLLVTLSDLLQILSIAWWRVSIAVEALKAAGGEIEGDSEYLKIILFLDRCAGVKRQPAFCFLGHKEDTFMNPRVNPEPKELLFLVNKWQKNETSESSFPSFTFGDFQRFTNSQGKWQSVKSWSLGFWIIRGWLAWFIRVEFESAFPEELRDWSPVLCDLNPKISPP